MGGKSTPDFSDIAAGDTEASRQSVKDQIYANRPDQYTPWGYTSWQNNPYTDAAGNTYDKWTQTTGLSPELQDIFNKQMAIQGGRTDIAGMLTGRMGADFGQSMDWRNLSPVGQVPTAQYTLPEGGVDDPYQTRQRAEDAMYQSAMSRIQPQQESQRAALETKMRNQGLRPGDAAWQSQMQGLGQQHTDQSNQAMWSSVGEGRAESGQMFGQQLQDNQNRFNQALGANNQNFGQSMQASQYANQIRQQQMAEMMQQRGFNLNEINALLSGQQVGMPSMPSFNQQGAYNPASGMTAAAQQASMENANNPWNAVAGLAGSALGGWSTTWSDRRLKKNIQRVGTVKGYPWYKYDYIWGEPSQGVMADEIPEEYTVDVGGFKAVNYGALLGD